MCVTKYRTYVRIVFVVATGVTAVYDRAARFAGWQLRTRCAASPRRPSRRRRLLPGLAAVPGQCAVRPGVSRRLMVGHARLLVTEPRWWEAPMLRSRVTELHYITPIANLSSIVARGILSHNLAARLPHTSVSLESVQDRRARRRVPQGRPLHDYANLYFNARNAMMYKLKYGDVPLTVVCLEPAVLDLLGSIITDGNAASNDTIFLPSPSGLARLDEDRIYADSWDNQDYWAKVELKRAKCAELLVLNRIEPRFVVGCYVDHRDRRLECSSRFPALSVEVNAHVFFGGVASKTDER